MDVQSLERRLFNISLLPLYQCLEIPVKTFWEAEKKFVSNGISTSHIPLSTWTAFFFFLTAPHGIRDLSSS